MVQWSRDLKTKKVSQINRLSIDYSLDFLFKVELVSLGRRKEKGREEVVKLSECHS